MESAALKSRPKTGNINDTCIHGVITSEPVNELAFIKIQEVWVLRSSFLYLIEAVNRFKEKFSIGIRLLVSHNISTRRRDYFFCFFSEERKHYDSLVI